MNNQRRENFEFFEYDDKKFKIGKFTALTGTYLIANYFPKILYQFAMLATVKDVTISLSSTLSLVIKYFWLA